MTQVSIQRTIDGVLTSADAAYLVVTDKNGFAIVPSVLVAPTSAGIYIYDTTYLPPDRYTATWTFQVTGEVDESVARTFVVDAPLVASEGITLAELEYAVARRVGPAQKVRAANANTTSQTVVTKLKTSRDVGDIEDQYLLRRGVMWNGTWVPGFLSDDRSRAIDAFTPANGLLTVERVWTNSPVENEAFEILYLDPENELRPAIVEGLGDCYFWDSVQLAISSSAQRFNVTALVPWITRPSQLGAAYAMLSNQLFAADRVLWYRPYMMGRYVWIETEYLGYGTLRLEALRPVSSYVNGEYSPAGPSDDQDMIFVDKSLACLAGHRACWINYPDRLAPVAHDNMRPTMAQVATAFTIRSQAITRQAPEYVMHRWAGPTDPGLVGNLPEVPN